MENQEGTNLGDLPEGCIANIISFTSPPDVCRMSLVSRTFRSAADSDTVWKRLLPPDYHSLLSTSDDGPLLLSLPSKKQLFFSLCHNPIFINGENKIFWLDKWSGKKCYMLAARSLTIVWGDTPRYWAWINFPGSRFKEVAKLVLVWWLEIRGKIDTSLLSPTTVYTAYLVFKLAEKSYGLDWYPTKVSVGLTENERNESAVCLVPDHYSPAIRRRVHGLTRPSMRNDGWLEIKLGDYFNGLKEDREVLEMSLMEVRGARKRGLIVQGIEIRPKTP